MPAASAAPAVTAAAQAGTSASAFSPDRPLAPSFVAAACAGASRELIEALPVNPYDIGETANAIHLALQMPRDERRDRMHLMRQTVKENNVYRWAGRILMDAGRVRKREQLARRISERSRRSGIAALLADRRRSRAA